MSVVLTHVSAKTLRPTHPTRLVMPWLGPTHNTSAVARLANTNRALAYFVDLAKVVAQLDFFGVFAVRAGDVHFF